ncbi:uncharacterized protein V6R79_013825 [Siganus canaliculatus]
MALKNLISTKVDIPTFVPTPLRVAVLKIAETPRVISWTFDDFSVKPAVVKKNKTVVISDGQSLAKITLYEGSGSRLEEVVHLEKYTTASSLVTVHINIIEDLKVTTVCLWREAATFSLNVGEAVSITHLKPKSADHGWFLQSTAFTKNGSSSFTFPKGQQPLLPPQTTRHKSPKNNGNLQSAVEDIRRQRGKTSCHKELTDQKSFITVEGKAIAETLTATVNLWREAALTEVQSGETVSISHLKTGTAQYALHSTNFTGLKKQSSFEAVTVLCSDLAAASIKVSIQVEDNVIKVIQKITDTEM